MAIPKPAVAMCAAGAVLMVIGWLAGPAIVERRRAEVRRGWVLTPALVTTADLKVGDPLTQVERRDVPEQFITSRTATELKVLDGKHASIALPEGTPVHLGATEELGPCP